MTQTQYSASELVFTYPLGSQKVQALRGVSLEIATQEFVCLSGPSGSGKTTLLGLLGLIEPVQDGELRFEGRDVTGMEEEDRNDLRRFEIGFIFQQFHLFPVLTAIENVDYFLSRQGILPEEREERARRALEAVGLADQMHKRPLEMSGGQRQRVAIARAIAKRPKVILADEPTASLDQATGREVLSILRRLNEDSGVTVIVSSHDPMAQAFARRQIRLLDGALAGAPTGGLPPGGVR
jgi:putative ABC transport system ATP-binding protein